MAGEEVEGGNCIFLSGIQGLLILSWPDYNEFSRKKKNVSASLASSIGLYLKGRWDKMFELGHILKNPVLQWANIFALCLLGSSNWKRRDSGSHHRLKNLTKSEIRLLDKPAITCTINSLLQSRAFIFSCFG